MNLSFDPVTLSFESTGEITGNKFEGVFQVKPTLSYLERFEADRDKRFLLGAPKEDESVSNDLLQLAVALSQLRARVVEGPSWYKESAGLRLGFIDTNSVFALANSILGVETTWREGIQAQAKAAKEKLTTPTPNV